MREVVVCGQKTEVGVRETREGAALYRYTTTTSQHNWLCNSLKAVSHQLTRLIENTVIIVTFFVTNLPEHFTPDVPVETQDVRSDPVHL